MSTLHERLLAAITQHGGPLGVGTALRAVVELHAPRERVLLRGLPSECTVIECTGCLDDGPAWPCSTIQAIARELGVDERADNNVHIASDGDSTTLCGAQITPSTQTTTQPASSSCDECFQLALEEADGRG